MQRAPWIGGGDGGCVDGVDARCSVEGGGVVVQDALDGANLRAWRDRTTPMILIPLFSSSCEAAFELLLSRGSAPWACCRSRTTARSVHVAAALRFGCDDVNPWSLNDFCGPDSGHHRAEPMQRKDRFGGRLDCVERARRIEPSAYGRKSCDSCNTKSMLEWLRAAMTAEVFAVYEKASKF